MVYPVHEVFILNLYTGKKIKLKSSMAVAGLTGGCIFCVAVAWLGLGFGQGL